MLTCRDCDATFERRGASGPIPTRCEPCTKEHRRQLVAAGSRLYRKRHPERAKSSHEKWLAANPGKFAAYRRRETEWRAAHPEVARAWYAANREMVRASQRMRDYGLPATTYAAMVEAQDGRCAICRQPERVRNRDGRPQPLGVDHDHDTDEVRGLLCRTCNIGIGHLNDDPELLEAAAGYLRAASRRRLHLVETEV